MNYSKWCSRWGLSTRVSIDRNGSWRVGLSDTGHVRRTCKICSSTMWQWRGDSPPQDMPRSDLNSLALGTRLASGLGRARQKYVFVSYRELAYVKWFSWPRNILICREHLRWEDWVHAWDDTWNGNRRLHRTRGSGRKNVIFRIAPIPLLSVLIHSNRCQYATLKVSQKIDHNLPVGCVTHLIVLR